MCGMWCATSSLQGKERSAVLNIYLWLSKVEIEHIPLRIAIVLPQSKCYYSAELLLSTI